MAILVSGAEGFVGRHFASKIPVIGLGSKERPVDIRDPQAIRDFLAGQDFDAVIHLAAISDIPGSLRDPLGTYQVNFFGTFHLLQALQDSGFCGRFLFVGSAEEYGNVPESQLPICETAPLRPANPYAASKVAAEALCHQFQSAGQFPIVMTRSFNHIGPGQSDRFAAASFAKQVAEIKLGRREPRLQVGDLAVSRDFLDVRDVVDAYLALLERGQPGEVYNICSGTERGIGALLEQLIEQAGVKAKIEVDPARVRPVDQKRFVGSAEKLQRATEWRPKIAFQQTLKDVLSYWEGQIA